MTPPHCSSSEFLGVPGSFQKHPSPFLSVSSFLSSRVFLTIVAFPSRKPLCNPEQGCKNTAGESGEAGKVTPRYTGASPHLAHPELIMWFSIFALRAGSKRCMFETLMFSKATNLPRTIMEVEHRTHSLQETHLLYN